jgi:RecA/RadA recombinase
MSKKKKAAGTTVVDTSMFSTAEECLAESVSNVLIPVGPALDLKLRGGIPSGSFVLIRTLPKVGKSSLAMQIAVNALAQGRYVVYCDIERRLEGDKYFQYRGFDPKNPKFIVFRAKKGEELISGDDIYTNIKNMMMMPKYRGAVYIIDSFSKVTPKATLEDNTIRADRRDGTPKLNADFCKKVGNLVRISDSVVIGIQHFITDPNQNPMFGDTLKPDGGNKLEYDADIVLESKSKPKMWDGKSINLSENQELPGLMLRLNMPYNKRGAPYVSKMEPIECFIKFGEGIWWAKEAFEVVKALGLCDIKGHTYNFTMPDGTTKSAKGMDNAVALLESEREVFEKVLRDYFITKYKANYTFVPPEDEDDE